MADNKNQHYVPKYYMKNFANEEGLVACFMVEKSLNLGNIPYKKQCAKNYLYGINLEVEKYLGKKEVDWKNTIDKIINNESLTLSDILTIKELMIFQYNRTLSREINAKEQLSATLIAGAEIKMSYENKDFDKQLLEEEAYKYCSQKEVHLKNLISVSNEMMKYSQDLNIQIITYSTDNKLFYSDSPVLLINPFIHSLLGIACPGYMMIMPICAEKLIVLYDPKIYTRYNKDLYLEIENDYEVNLLNELQYINANKTLYASPQIKFSFDVERLNELRKVSKQASAPQILGDNKQKMICHMPFRIIHDFELSFASMNHHARKVPRDPRVSLFFTREHTKECEKSLNERIEINRLTMYKKEIPVTSSSQCIKELQSIVRFAHIYWSWNEIPQPLS